MLSEYRDIQILGQADSGAALMELLSHMKADVLVLDIELPDISGLELCQKVLSKYPAIRILILSMYTGEEFIFKALAEGAKGYLPKIPPVKNWQKPSAPSRIGRNSSVR